MACRGGCPLIIAGYPQTHHRHCVRAYVRGTQSGGGLGIVASQPAGSAVRLHHRSFLRPTRVVARLFAAVAVAVAAATAIAVRANRLRTFFVQSI